MYQYYVIIISKDSNDEYTHDVKWAFDADADTARLRAESLYHAELANAAISNRVTHAVTLLSSDGVPMLYHCYKHNPQSDME